MPFIHWWYMPLTERRRTNVALDVVILTAAPSGASSISGFHLWILNWRSCRKSVQKQRREPQVLHPRLGFQGIGCPRRQEGSGFVPFCTDSQSWWNMGAVCAVTSVLLSPWQSKDANKAKHLLNCQRRKGKKKEKKKKKAFGHIIPSPAFFFFSHPIISP